MKQFRPPEKPFLERVAKSFPFQIAAVTAIIGGLIFSIYWSQREHISQTLQKAFEKDTSPQVSEEIAGFKGSESQALAPAPPSESENEAGGDSASSEIAAPGDELQESTKATGASVGASTSAQKPRGLRLDYVEVPEPLLQQWLSEGQVLNETGNSKSILLGAAQRLNDLRRQDWKLVALPGGRTLPLNSSVIAKDEHMGAGTSVGFSLEIDPRQIESEKVDFEVQITASFPGGLDQAVTTTTWSGRYTIPTQSTLVILGLVPRQSMKDTLVRSFTGGPLQIYQSREFLSSASEFALVIRPAPSLE
jgi:hypothetical protein